MPKRQTNKRTRIKLRGYGRDDVTIVRGKEFYLNKDNKLTLRRYGIEETDDFIDPNSEIGKIMDAPIFNEGKYYDRYGNLISETFEDLPENQKVKLEKSKLALDILKAQQAGPPSKPGQAGVSRPKVFIPSSVGSKDYDIARVEAFRKEQEVSKAKSKVSTALSKYKKVDEKKEPEKSKELEREYNVLLGEYNAIADEYEKIMDRIEELEEVEKVKVEEQKKVQAQKNSLQIASRPSRKKNQEPSEIVETELGNPNIPSSFNYGPANSRIFDEIDQKIEDISGKVNNINQNVIILLEKQSGAPPPPPPMIEVPFVKELSYREKQDLFRKQQAEQQTNPGDQITIVESKEEEPLIPSGSAHRNKIEAAKDFKDFIKLRGDMEEYVKTRPSQGYPKDFDTRMRLVSFIPSKYVDLTDSSKESNIFPIGSIAYQVQRYPGDFDFWEVDKVMTDSPDKAIDLLVKYIRQTVTKVEKSRDNYFIELKAGNFNKLEKLRSKLLDKILDNPPRKMSSLSKLLSPDENDFLIQVLSSSLTIIEKEDIINTFFDSRASIKWSASEIKAGIKKNFYGTNITLKEAIANTVIIKIDIISFFEGRFIEISNNVYLSYFDKYYDKYVPINLSLDDNISSFDENIKENIEKLMYSTVNKNVFKGMKRIYSLCREMLKKGDQEISGVMKQILTILISDIALVYRIKGDLDTINSLLKNEPKMKLGRIKKSVDKLKFQFSSVYEIGSDISVIIFNMFDAIVKEKDVNQFQFKIKRLSSYFLELVNNVAVDYLTNNGLNPLPSVFLPKNSSYEQIMITPKRVDFG